MKQKLLEMVHDMFNFFLRNRKNEGDGVKKMRVFSVICKIGQNQSFRAINGSFLRFHQNKQNLKP